MATSSDPIPGSLPTGTVAFLFSDIDGSTMRWDTFREEMKAALRRHDWLLRSAVEENHGHVFKTVGDQFCTVFSTVPHAIAAAVSAQRAIAAEDWNAVDGLAVRMAIHAGVADERDGDYYGQSVNRAARLLAAAHGGQVIVSAAVADLAQGELPPDIRLRNLGLHRLKDLTAAEQVYQLVAPQLQDEFPPLASLDSSPNNLPAQLTPLLAREQEIIDLKRVLSESRLVSILGSGGSRQDTCCLASRRRCTRNVRARRLVYRLSLDY